MEWANLKKHLEGKCDGMFEKLPYKTKAGEEKHCLQAVKKYANVPLIIPFIETLFVMIVHHHNHLKNIYLFTNIYMNCLQLPILMLIFLKI